MSDVLDGPLETEMESVGDRFVLTCCELIAIARDLGIEVELPCGTANEEPASQPDVRPDPPDRNFTEDQAVGPPRSPSMSGTALRAEPLIAENLLSLPGPMCDCVVPRPRPGGLASL